MRNRLAVSAQRSVGPVEHGGGSGVLDVETPFPVGEVAFVAAVVAEALLIGVGEVAMPG
jgi:hypothetical protein